MATPQMTLPSSLYVGGSWRTDGSAGTYDHVNPATGKVQQGIPMAGAAEVDEAVAAARAAFAEWRRWRPDERRRLLTRISAAIRRNADELAILQALENGLPVSLGRDMMVNHGADWFESSASWADKLEGTVVPTQLGKSFDFTLLEPIGVVGVVLTWNAPVGGWGMCVSPALAAGCCVILKPSELAPFSSMRIAQICEEEGLPPGVLSVLPGGPQAGASLVEHPGVNKISFTGGAATGRKIAVACAHQLKPLVLELGGKSANVVFDDADLTKAVEVAARIVGLAGQACTLPSRILVQNGIYDEFIEKVAAAVKAVPVGDPMDPATLMGPVITADACERVIGMVERAAAEPDVEILTGGGKLDGDLADGFYVEPTVVANVAPQAEIALQEVFGPVTAATRFTDEDEAIAMANATSYGLAGYVHTRDVSRALRMASALEAGNIGVNGGDAPAGPGAPFGGVKESGYGREGGLNGLLEFVNVKNVLIETS